MGAVGRPYGSFEPDQPVTVHGISRNIDGAVPIADNDHGVSYGPYRSLQTPANATALAEKPKGVISLVNSSGVSRLFVGQSTSIVEIDASWGPTDIDTGLSLATDDDWSFAHFGSYLIATNTDYGMWAYNVDTSSGAGPIGGNAPKARQVFATNETLIALDCDGDNRRWENCALGNHTIWPGAGSTLSANGDSLEDGGALIAGRDLSNGRALIFQDEAIRILQFGGGSLFSIGKLASDIGSVGERSLIEFNGIVYGLHTKGFFATNGAEIRWIGERRVDKTFLATLTPTTLNLVDVEVDPANKLVMWYYNGTMWCYNWAIDKWSTFTQSMNAIIRIGTPGYTVDTASAIGNVDTIPYSPDAKFWQGGAKILGAFGTDNKIAFFDGANIAAELDTMVHNNPTRDLILEATPITDDAAVTVSVGVSEQLQESIDYGPDEVINDEGFAPVDGAGRNTTFRVKHAAGAAWTYDRGVNPSAGVQGGVR